MQKRNPSLHYSGFLLFFILIACAAGAQTVPLMPISMLDAVTLGKNRYHQLKAVQSDADAASKNVDVAKYSRLPTIDAAYQANMGTANNLTGMFYPGTILPITGPPSGKNVYDPVSGSGAGILINWQAVTFGQRNAQINTAVAEVNSKKSALTNQTFQHSINVLSTYLDVLLSIDLISINQRNIDRITAGLSQSKMLVSTGIKPGVDTALFLSELSKARIDLLNARKQLETQQWTLAELIATDSLPVPTDTSFLEKLPVTEVQRDSGTMNHPVVKFGQSQLEASKAREAYIRKSYLPKLSVWGTGFARGSGFQPDGSVKTWDGLGLSRYNYGVGLQLSFSILKYGEVRQQLAQQEFISKSAQENLEQNKQSLLSQQRIANTTFDNNIAVARETQQQLESAKYAFSAMQFRYNTGLVSFADLIQSQYNLFKAELDLKRSYWDAWKALLLKAAVTGDEQVFINEIR
ncbi:TolC family protein [Danxiaibacter flavus]|uniref:TolC family protein n=1 Tax=Danxiaibacter flavus TaxID=3049108 RepID=A0ABV3ZIZ4_9BACT|nr:TolC family protein [Chitinophagaceae bacterium DXS]